MSLCNGQEINYAQLASDTGIPARTIEGHIEVLKDTLIAFEQVDLIVGNKMAIEIKFAEKLRNEMFDGLLSLKEEALINSYSLVGRFSREGEFKGCRYWNWRTFLENLWNDKLL